LLPGAEVDVAGEPGGSTRSDFGEAATPLWDFAFDDFAAFAAFASRSWASRSRFRAAAASAGDTTPRRARGI
jgi:hypothetical protein